MEQKMARVKDQDIPPEFAALYKQALGETRPIAFPGGKHPGLLDAVCKQFPETLEPPHVPTEDQLEQRAYFLESIACFNAAPLNERFGYWQLSLQTGLWYYDFYHSENIPRFIDGETCEDISRPLTSAFLGEEPLCPAHIAFQFHSEEELILTFDATLDHCHYYRCIEDDWYKPYVLFQAHWDYDAEPPGWAYDLIQFFEPTERTRYSQEITLPYSGSDLRRVNFDRFSLDDTQAVTWKFQVNTEVDFYDYDNWSEIPGFPPP